MKDISVVDLFAGIGGFAVGLRRFADDNNLNIKYKAVVDIDEDALEIYRVNHNVSSQNVYACSVADWLNDLHSGKIPTFNCDLLIGGPPCQGNSKVNTHYRVVDDPRNNLYELMADAAFILNAGAIIIENMRYVVRSPAYQRTVDRLTNAGYYVTRGVLRLDKLGGPQIRARHFLVATKNRYPYPIVEAQYQFAAPPIRASELFAQPMSQDKTLLKLPSMSSVNKVRVDYLFDNNIYDLPLELRPDSQRLAQHRSSYNRIHPDSVCVTITTHQHAGAGRYIHPTERRAITAAEAAAIQEFPADYKWRSSSLEPSNTAIRRWIGNAVPATLAYAAIWCALS